MRKSDIAAIVLALVFLVFTLVFRSIPAGSNQLVKLTAADNISETENEFSRNNQPEEFPSVETDELININTASQYELTELKGIGKALAGRIVEYREKYGAFESVEEIMNVSGIGEKTFNEIADCITVG